MRLHHTSAAKVSCFLTRVGANQGWNIPSSCPAQSTLALGLFGMLGATDTS